MALYNMKVVVAPVVVVEGNVELFYVSLAFKRLKAECSGAFTCVLL